MTASVAARRSLAVRKTVTPGVSSLFAFPPGACAPPAATTNNGGDAGAIESYKAIGLVSNPPRRCVRRRCLGDKYDERNTPAVVTTENRQQAFDERDDIADDKELSEALSAYFGALKEVDKSKADLKSAREHAANLEDIYQALLKDRELPGGTYRVEPSWVVEVVDVDAHQRFSVSQSLTAAG